MAKIKISMPANYKRLKTMLSETYWQT